MERIEAMVYFLVSRQAADSLTRGLNGAFHSENDFALFSTLFDVHHPKKSFEKNFEVRSC
jgi:hypothetical protein